MSRKVATYTVLVLPNLLNMMRWELRTPTDFLIIFLRPVLMVTEYTPVKRIPLRDSIHPMQTFGFYFTVDFLVNSWKECILHKYTTEDHCYCTIYQYCCWTSADAPIAALRSRSFPECGVQLKYLTKLRDTLAAYCCVQSLLRKWSSIFWEQLPLRACVG